MAKDNWDVLWEDYKKLDIHKEIIDYVKSYSTGKKVLEVGFGTGGDLHELSKKGFNVTGIDKSRISINKARKNKLKFKAVKGDAENLPFESESFNTVFHQGVLEHFKNPGSFIFEQWRVLKNEGTLIVDVPHKWNLYTVYKKIKYYTGSWYGGWERSYSANELRKLLTEKGFDVVETKYYGIWPHQIGKIIYPENIKSSKLAKKILQHNSFKKISTPLKKLYENNNFFKLINSYNLIVVAKKRQIRVAVDARHLEDGGIGEYVSRIIESENSQVKIIPISNKNNNKKSIVLKEKLHRFVWEQLTLLKYLKTTKPDLYHATSNWGIPLLYRGKSILTIHDIIPSKSKKYFSNSKNELLAKTIYIFSMITSAFKARRIISTSKHNVNLITSTFKTKNSKFLVIPMGVDKTLLNSKVKHKENYILHNGGIAERKNIDKLIDAFSIYSKNNTGKLIITGEKNALQKRLVKKCRKLGLQQKVIFTGRIEQKKLTNLIKKAKVVVYPSDDEGFGMPVLEAMAAKTPVVASNIKSIKSYAKNVPTYINPSNEKSIAKGMLKAGKNTKSRINKGHQIAQDYSWERIITQTQKIYLKNVFCTSGENKV